MADMDLSLTFPIDDGAVQSAAGGFSSAHDDDDINHIIDAELQRVFGRAGGDGQDEGNSNSDVVSVFQLDPESGFLTEEIVQRRDYLEPARALNRLVAQQEHFFETIVDRARAFGGRGAYSGGGAVVPASDAVVAGLEKRAFHAATEGRDSKCGGGVGCAICLVDFEDGEEVTVMPCSGGHEFHTGCITKWLGKSKTCPLCRHALPTQTSTSCMDDVDD